MTISPTTIAKIVPAIINQFKRTPKAKVTQMLSGFWIFGTVVLLAYVTGISTSVLAEMQNVNTVAGLGDLHNMPLCTTPAYAAFPDIANAVSAQNIALTVHPNIYTCLTELVQGANRGVIYDMNTLRSWRLTQIINGKVFRVLNPFTPINIVWLVPAQAIVNGLLNDLNTALLNLAYSANTAWYQAIRLAWFYYPTNVADPQPTVVLEPVLNWTIMGVFVAIGACFLLKSLALRMRRCMAGRADVVRQESRVARLTFEEESQRTLVTQEERIHAMHGEVNSLIDALSHQVTELANALAKANAGRTTQPGRRELDIELPTHRSFSLSQRRS